MKRIIDKNLFFIKNKDFHTITMRVVFPTYDEEKDLANAILLPALVGYMNEEFAVAFNDIDFCLKIRNTGKLIVYHPFVELWHYESKSRGDDNAPEKLERFQKEINLFLETWKDKLSTGDEYYNKNLSLESDQYDIRTDKVI